MDCIPRSKFLSILICLFVSGSGCFSATEDKLAGQTASAAADVQDNASTARTLAIPSADHVVPASQYNLLSWNVESDGATSKVICKQLAKLNQNDHYDILTLSEVLPSDLKKFRYALGKHYKYVYSKSGFSDRLEILYNENNFELVRHFEIKEINILNRYRAPLVAQLKDRATGTEFMVMVNHLARGKAEIRQKQATMLVEWARDQTLPVFALGDYNFDFVFKTRKGNPAFSNMLKDNIWRWVEPVELIDTNWYDNPRNLDGIDDYPGSMLDFAFVTGSAKDWKSTCRVLVREGDFPDDKTTSDHRPFELTIVKP
jgi:endonuclease/exonuclease/phosphatase family metal-dependent hydrolase